MPALSVILPVFNRADSVAAAIESAQKQSFAEIEIVVVDDASTDATVSIVRDLATLDKRIRLIEMPANRGAAEARNAGIAVATGDWLALLDSDDLWLPQKLERQLALNADLSVCDALFEDAQGARHARQLPRLTKRRILAGQGLNTGSSLLVRREVFARIGPFDEGLKRLEDWDWLIKASLLGFVPAVLPEALAVIRVGAPPATEAVIEAADRLQGRYKPALAPGRERGDFLAACALEKAAACLWQHRIKDFAGFYAAALGHSPVLAVSFALTRVMRVLTGDAPRFFRLFSNK